MLKHALSCHSYKVNPRKIMEILVFAAKKKKMFYQITKPLFSVINVLLGFIMPECQMIDYSYSLIPFNATLQIVGIACLCRDRNSWSALIKFKKNTNIS